MRRDTFFWHRSVTFYVTLKKTIPSFIKVTIKVTIHSAGLNYFCPLAWLLHDFGGRGQSQPDRAVLTLSSTLTQRSAPHNDTTRFSLSSSWLRFCTYSLTVTRTRTELSDTLTGTWHSAGQVLDIGKGIFLQCYRSIETSKLPTHLPLSTIWSNPPRSLSSSLNQSPALLEVRESRVSMARWPVYNRKKNYL